MNDRRPKTSRSRVRPRSKKNKDDPAQQAGAHSDQALEMGGGKQSSRARSLDPPFPSSPSRPPKHVFRFSRRTDLRSIEGFSALYSARKFIDEVLAGEETRWEDDHTLITLDSGIKIHGVSLQDVMEYEFKPAEREWQLPEPYLSQAKSINLGKPVEIKRTAVEALPPSTPRERRTSIKRDVPDGHTTISQLCEELGIDASKARAKLRAANIEKPYAWATKDLEKIKKVIK